MTVGSTSRRIRTNTSGGPVAGAAARELEALAHSPIAPPIASSADSRMPSPDLTDSFRVVCGSRAFAIDVPHV